MTADFPLPEPITIRQRLDRIQKLAKDDANGDLLAHKELLTAIRGLQLDVENPFDTLFRLNFQVCKLRPSEFL